MPSHPPEAQPDPSEKSSHLARTAQHEDERQPARSNSPAPGTPANSAQQLELQLFERLDGFRGRPPEKAIFREHLNLLLRKGCEYMIGSRRVTPNALYSVANAIYLRTVRGVARVSHRQLAIDAFTSKRTVTAAIGVLQLIGLIRVVSESVRHDAAVIALCVGTKTWPAFCGSLRRAPNASQLNLLPPPPGRSRGDGSSPRPATDQQVQFAEDLGIDPDGKDLVELGKEIERARTNRVTSTPEQQRSSQSPVLRRRLAEAQAHGRTGALKRIAPEDPDTAAAHRQRQALETAAAVGYEPAADEPGVMVRQRDGHRIRI